MKTNDIVGQALRLPGATRRQHGQRWAGGAPALQLIVASALAFAAPLARAVSAPPPPDMQSWLTGDDAPINHIWHRARTFYDSANCATGKDDDGFSLRQLAFADRVAYQRAIEEVYWRHRIWSRERPDRKPSLEEMMSQATFEKKVQDYLRESELLEQELQKPITPEQLQAEMERMASHSKQPQVLRELFAALGNDPFVIAECLARPVLSERLLTKFYAHDQESSESWSVRAQNQTPNVAAVTASYTLPAISDQPSECIDDSWTATTMTNAPTGRYEHTAVWTGTEMIVWGGHDLNFVELNTGGRYNPSTDSWTATSTINAPTARTGHAAVWTGSEKIVWGGQDVNGNTLNTGGRYDPSTDSWTATSRTNAPSRRSFHTAVWTGREMIVWSGKDPVGLQLSTGGKYNPGTDGWTATSISNAPTGRLFHTAVWTGREMIVWGGLGSSDLNTGGRYNPSADSWTAISTTNAPTARHLHTAVSTGSEMIVWGGSTNPFMNTGGRYNLGADSWIATTTTHAPSARFGHAAIWTGSEMIVWGGYGRSGEVDTGGRYDPGTDSWTATNTTHAPTAREFHTAMWTGSEMIVWGGDGENAVVNTGGRYCAQAVSAITLDARVYRREGKRFVVLTWSPADGGSVDVLRDGSVIGTTDDDGAAKDTLGTQTGIFTYQVCETDSDDCSNEVRVRVGGTDD